MAIESAACFRRLARTGLSVLIGISSLCGVATAQKQLVSSGSIIPLSHSNSYGQIYTIDIAPNGDTLFLDVSVGSGGLYQLKKGSTTFQTITTSISPAGDTYFNEGMAIDAKGTLYITARYGSPYMYRVPYNAADGTYDFSASGDSWEPTLDSGFEGHGTQNAFFLDNPAKDGSGILYVSEQDSNVIIIPVSADGTVPLFPSGPNAGQPQFQYLIKGLKDKVMPMVADVNGNLYMIENPYDPPASRVTGIFFVPASAYKSCMAASAAGTADPTVPCISGTESALTRVDAGNPEKYNGITIDAAGNLYVGSSNDGYGGTINALIEIPNESGSPIGVTAASFNFSDAQYLAPIAVNANPTIDPRGFIWLPTGGAGNFSPNGSSSIPGTGNFVLWQLGTANVGATPIGTPSATGTVFYTFSGSATVASLAFSQPGSGTDFSAVATNPYPPTGSTTPAVPCGNTTTGTPPTYIVADYCEYWFALTPTGANSVGDISAQLSMLDPSSNVISGSTTYVSGIGEGPAVSLLVPAQQTPLSTGLVTPQQVAGDSLGNSYVADSGLGKVLEFAAGSTTASAGTSIGTGLKAPTGVAVDGAGDVYIGDSGQVIEVPAVNGKLNPGGQFVLQSGLGTHLNLAVDEAQNVYVADPDNARVVRIYNPQMGMIIEGIKTMGTGFTKPTAVAVDDSGNLYVADGANLDEVNFWNGQTTITSNLTTPVTGLAVDPSNSVYVAQGGGILRIPLEAAGLNFNDAGLIDGGGVTAPSGLGIDSLGNFYVTAASYTVSTIDSSGAGTSTVTTPSLLLLNGALVNFGLVSQDTQSNPINVDVYNIGNAPLALTGAPTFSGANAADYSIQADGQNPCDTSGGTTVASATVCQLGVTVTAAGLGLSQASMAVTTNAANAPTTNAALEAYSSNLLCRTLTTITLNPATGLTYPGGTTVTSTTVPDPAHPCAAGGMPQNGIISLTLAPQAKGAQPTTQNLKLTSATGQQTFTLSGLNGGTYAVYASYKGDPVYGGSTSSKTFTFVVAQATPTIALSEPAGINPINGTYYVLQGSTTTIQATVTSPVGKPTGSVQFLSGTKPADTTQNPVTLSGSGTAILNTSNLALGTYTITAIYSSDVNFAAVTSSAITIVVIQPSVLITASPATVTTKAGTPVTSTLTLTALEGYSPSMNVQLYCETTPVDTVPPFAECTFDVPTVDLKDFPGVPQISHVTINSNIPTNETAFRSTSSPIAFAGLLGLSLLGLTLRRKGKFGRSPLVLGCLMLVFAGMFAGFTGCTNSGYTHTPPAPVVTTPTGTYNVSIYALDISTGKVTSLPSTLTVTIQ